MADYISQITLPNNVTYDLKDAAALPKSGGILTGGLEVKGHIAGDNSTTTGHGLYSGGMYHNAYNNIILHGDATTGSSGIAFVSDKVNATTGAITNINAPSDRAFIQYHAYGVSTPTAEGTAPTIATSGEAGRLVIGIGNDSGDKIILQAPGTTDIIHQIGVNSYPIPHTTNTNGSVGGTTTPVYVDAGVIKAGTALGGAAYKAENYYALSGHNHDSTYSYIHLSDYDFTDTQPLSKYVTFDKSRPTGAPKEEWYNGFISSHSNYHASYIINGHTNQNEWYVGHGIWREANTPHATAPTWYLLAHSGNVDTGDNNGQVKIAGVNISVKGLGSAAYTETSAYAANSHNHNASDINAGTLSVDRLPEDVVRKRDSFSSSTTELDLVKLNPGMYDFTVNPNNLLPTSYGTILNIHGKYKYGSLIDAATNNVLYYRSYYYNTDSNYEWRGNWQMVAHANSGTAVGGAKIPVYINATGVITAGDALKALAYKDSLVTSDIPNLDWSKITSGKPTTLSGYGITDAKIASGVITLGSNTITPITSIADLTGSTITATDLRTNLGLSAALRFIGKATTDMSESTTTAPTVTGVTNYVPEIGDVVLDKNSDAEYVCIAKSGSTYTWELLGRSGSWATSTHTHGNITNGGLLGTASMAVVTDGSKKITTADLSVSDSNASTNATTTFVQAVTQSAQGKITVTKASLNTSGTWSGNATTATTATYIKCTDTRSTALNPTDLTASQGVRFDFKAKGTINLTATDPYAGVMSFRPYASNSDWSGGNAHQLAFNSEGLHWRNGGASWGNWYQILDSNNTAAGTNANASLSWGSTYTLAKINGTDIKITAMAKPSYAFTDLTSHPTTLSGYGITDAKIASGAITLGSNTITPVTSVNGHTGASVSVTASDLDITYPDIKPTISKTYAPANSYGTTDAEATCCFFFMSVKPDSWYKGWQVRFKVRTLADSYANVDSTTWCTLNGRADSFIYHNWNERYDIGHYYIVGRALKSAGFNAGLGHMVGVNVRYSTGRGTAAYTRKIYLDYYDCEGCTVTILDAANLWDNLGNTTNYSDTNYNGYTNMDAVNRGLRETSDDNSTTISHLYMQYGGNVAANLLCRYQFVFENAEHKFVSIYGTDNAYGTTNKTLLTIDFDPNGRIYYHNTSGTTAANANIDPGRLYYSVLADLRYSFNVSSSAVSGAFTGTRYLPLYLKTQMTASTGMVHVASNQPLVTSLPTSADNYYYIYLGQIHDWYRVMLEREHPVYYHNGTEVVKYLGKTLVDFSNNSANSEKVTAKLDTIHKAYLLGTTTTPTAAGVNVAPVGDTGVYLTSTAGQLNATSYKVNEKVVQSWNATSQCLEFQFI